MMIHNDERDREDTAGQSHCFSVRTPGKIIIGAREISCSLSKRGNDRNIAGISCSHRFAHMKNSQNVRPTDECQIIKTALQ